MSDAEHGESIRTGTAASTVDTPLEEIRPYISHFSEAENP